MLAEACLEPMRSSVTLLSPVLDAAVWIRVRWPSLALSTVKQEHWERSPPTAAQGWRPDDRSNLESMLPIPPCRRLGRS